MKYRVLKRCYFGGGGERLQLLKQNEIYEGNLEPEDAPAYLQPLDDKAKEAQAKALAAKADDRANLKAKKNADEADEAEIEKSSVLEGGNLKPEDVPSIKYQNLKTEAAKRGFKGNGKAAELIEFIQNDIAKNS